MDKAEKAKQLLRGYFKMIAEKAGIRWDYENDCEIDWIVKLIIEAAREDKGQ